MDQPFIGIDPLVDPTLNGDQTLIALIGHNRAAELIVQPVVGNSGRAFLRALGIFGPFNDRKLTLLRAENREDGRIGNRGPLDHFNRRIKVLTFIKDLAQQQARRHALLSPPFQLAHRPGEIARALAIDRRMVDGSGKPSGCHALQTPDIAGPGDIDPHTGWRMSASSNGKSAKSVQFPVECMQQTAAALGVLDRAGCAGHLKGQIDNIGAGIALQGRGNTVNLQTIGYGCLVSPLLAGTIDKFQPLLGQLADSQVMNGPQPLWIGLGELVETAFTNVDQRYTRSTLTLFLLCARWRRWGLVFIILVIKVSGGFINHDSRSSCSTSHSTGRGKLVVILITKIHRLRICRGRDHVVIVGFLLDNWFRSYVSGSFRRADAIIITKTGNGITARHQIIIIPSTIAAIKT